MRSAVKDASNGARSFVARLTMAVALTAAALAVHAQTAPVHEGDIEPYLIDLGGGLRQIGVDPHGEAHIDALSGYKLFTADFGDFPRPYDTDDPGFDHESGAFLPGSILGFRGLGTLARWDANASAWLDEVPNGESIALRDVRGAVTVFATDGVRNAEGVIGQFSSSGNLHQHLVFGIAAASGLPATGAYLFTLQLWSRASSSSSDALYVDSAPFSILVNNGLSEEAFAAALAARTTPVPLPASLLLLLSGLAFPALRRRRNASPATPVLG